MEAKEVLTEISQTAYEEPQDVMHIFRLLLDAMKADAKRDETMNREYKIHIMDPFSLIYEYTVKCAIHHQPVQPTKIMLRYSYATYRPQFQQETDRVALSEIVQDTLSQWKIQTSHKQKYYSDFEGYTVSAEGVPYWPNDSEICTKEASIKGALSDKVPHFTLRRYCKTCADMQSPPPDHERMDISGFVTCQHVLDRVTSNPPYIIANVDKLSASLPKSSAAKMISIRIDHMTYPATGDDDAVYNIVTIGCRQRPTWEWTYYTAINDAFSHFRLLADFPDDRANFDTTSEHELTEIPNVQFVLLVHSRRCQPTINDGISRYTPIERVDESTALDD